MLVTASSASFQQVAGEMADMLMQKVRGKHLQRGISKYVSLA
jgi:hypothetical protein